jgi:hypothetical protein
LCRAGAAPGSARRTEAAAKDRAGSSSGELSALDGEDGRSKRLRPTSTTMIELASGNQAVGLVILASIVVPLCAVAGLACFFWRHRHDD